MKQVVRITILGICVLPIILAIWGVLILVTIWSLPEITRSDVIGNYAGHYDVFPKITAGYRKGVYKGGTHQLQVKADGTFAYLYSPTGGSSTKTTGTWTLLRKKRGSSIVFEGLALAPSSADTRKPGYWALPIHRPIRGPIRLTINDDLGYYWIKKKR